jgi:hypothetical protein
MPMIFAEEVDGRCAVLGKVVFELLLQLRVVKSGRAGWRFQILVQIGEREL